MRYDLERIRDEERRKFELAKFDRDRGLLELNKRLLALGKSPYEDSTGMASVHWLLFACLRSQINIRRILEIGTFDGETTAILAELFAESEIVTIELPDTDPLLRGTYDYVRGDPIALQAFHKRQAINTRSANIIAHRLNSFFLPAQIDGTFDLVWVDGGHLYPEIAWDLCNAYHATRDGGIIMCDDIIVDPLGYRDNYVSPDSYTVLRYITERTGETLQLFLKRESAEWSADPMKRKYVGLLTKRLPALQTVE